MSSYPFDLGKTIREMFPEQTKTPLRILIWTLILIADIVVVFLAAHLLGFDILAAANKRILYVYLVIPVALWLIEVHIYNKILGDA